MNFKLYKEANLLRIFKANHYSLFKLKNTKDTALEPISFIDKVSQLEVFEKSKIIITEQNVFDFSGNILFNHTGGEINIFEMNQSWLIVQKKNWPKNEQFDVYIWNGEKIIFSRSCQLYQYSDKYLATKDSYSWSIINAKGEVLNENLFVADNVQFCNDLLIKINVGDYALYKIENNNTTALITEQQKIIGSKFVDFAICSSFSSGAKVYYHGNWKSIKDAENFKILSDLHRLYYYKKNGKYFIQNYESEQFFAKVYPHGVDFVSFSEETLLIIDNGVPEFFTTSGE